MWRRSHPQHLEEEAEAPFDFVIVKPHDAEDRLLEIAVVDPDRAGPQLPPVPDEIVGLADCLARVGLDQMLVARRDAGERVVAERPPPGVFVPLEEREVEHPEKLVSRLVDQVEFGGKVGAQPSEHAGDDVLRVGGEQDGRRGIAPEELELRLREKLGDR